MAVVAKIPVYGPAVAEKIKQRLLGIEGDDAEKLYDE
jgi:protein O-GlcNAc transferase